MTRGVFMVNGSLMLVVGVVAMMVEICEMRERAMTGKLPLNDMELTV